DSPSVMSEKRTFDRQNSVPSISGNSAKLPSVPATPTYPVVSWPVNPLPVYTALADGSDGQTNSLTGRPSARVLGVIRSARAACSANGRTWVCQLANISPAGMVGL